MGLSCLVPELSPAGYPFCGSIENFYYTPDRCRPTWDRPKYYQLTKKYRRQLCIHVAAHATIYSICGITVHGASVAFAESNRAKTIYLGRVHYNDIFGYCETSKLHCADMVYDNDRDEYSADRADWESSILQPCRGMKRPQADCEKALASSRDIVWAYMCGYLAGHIADGISAGMNAEAALSHYGRENTQYVGVNDMITAQGLARLLPPGEYLEAVRFVEETLRRPDVWARVEWIASLLEPGGEFLGADLLGANLLGLARNGKGGPPGPGTPL